MVDITNPSGDKENAKFANEKDGVAVKTLSFGGFHLGQYDEIQVTYPNTTTDVFTYKLSTVTISTLTITYAATNKKDLVSIIRT